MFSLFRASFMKISRNFIKSPLNIYQISHIGVQKLWHVCIWWKDWRVCEWHINECQIFPNINLTTCLFYTLKYTFYGKVFLFFLYKTEYHIKLINCLEICFQYMLWLVVLYAFLSIIIHPSKVKHHFLLGFCTFKFEPVHKFY